MLTYGDITRDSAKLHPATLKALLSRGFSHYLGNEQASKVTSRIRTAIATATSTPEREVNQADVTKDQVQAFRESNPHDVSGFVASVMKSALEALDNGTIGTGRGIAAPKLDPVATAVRAITVAEIKTILASHGLKAPKGDEVVTFGDGSTRTLQQMIDKRLGDHGDRIRKEAEKSVAAAKRKAEAAKADAEAKKASGAPVTATSLGL